MSPEARAKIDAMFANRQEEWPKKCADCGNPVAKNNAVEVKSRKALDGSTLYRHSFCKDPFAGKDSLPDTSRNRHDSDIRRPRPRREERRRPIGGLFGFLDDDLL